MFEVLQAFKHYKQIDGYIFFIRADKSQTARAQRNGNRGH